MSAPWRPTFSGVNYGSPPLGSITGLDSRYKAMWYGAWLGVDLDWARDCWLSTVSMVYERDQYQADANWNLRGDLQHPISFQHLTIGSGVTLGASLSYLIHPKWSLGMQASVSRYETGAGFDTTYLADGTQGSTRLNQVSWGSSTVGIRANFYY